MKILVIVCFIVLLTGCGISRHEGRIDVYDADGAITAHYTATLDRPMMIEVVDQNGVTVKADSRGDSSWGQFLKGLFEILTLGLVVRK